VTRLTWPAELATGLDRSLPAYDAAQSLRLDLHGDPVRAQLVVCSDGNHHMALEETLQAFAKAYPDVGEIFYSTTPPRIAVEIVRGDGLQIGNFRLTIIPHVFIGPPQVMEMLVAEARVSKQAPFMQGRGLALLVRKGNPRHIAGIADLLRDDVRLFLSNPATETVSYRIYVDCLTRIAAAQNMSLDFLAHAPGQPDPKKLVYGEAIHHREAPERVADGTADVAAVFYHLGLRYQRIFPEIFEIIPLLRSPGETNCNVGHFNFGLVGDGGRWGAQLLQFLLSAQVTTIYARHGLERPA
jgi:hypothetical protein